jgi:hypothetical protein
LKILNLHTDNFYDFNGIKYLFVGANINQLNFFRIFNAYKELKDDNDIRISLTGAIINEKNEYINESSFKTMLTPDMVNYSDVIVLPPTPENLKITVKKIKEINNSVKILLDLYYNPFRIKGMSQQYKETPIEKATKIYSNLKYVDGFICSDEFTYKFTKDYIKKHNLSNVKYGNVFEPIFTKDFIDFSKENSMKMRDNIIQKYGDEFDENIKMLVLSDVDDYEPSSYNRTIIEYINKNYPLIDVYVYSTDPYWRKKTAFRGLDVKIINRKHIKYDLAICGAFEFDFAFIPILPKSINEFNKIFPYICLFNNIPLFSYENKIFNKFENVLGFLNLYKTRGELKGALIEHITEILRDKRVSKINFNYQNFITDKNNIKNEKITLNRIKD